MALRDVIAARPLIAALLFEGMLLPFAFALAWLLGLRPWGAFTPSVGVVAGAVVATVPLCAALAVLGALRPSWFRELEALVRPLIDLLFPAAAGRWLAIVAIAALAGLGEELLFRGVVQAWLAGLMNPWVAMVVAAILFGLAHAVSRAYFVLATVMGLYLGLLYELTGSLLLVSLVHALYDWIAILYLLRTSTHVQEREPLPGSHQ